MTDLNVPEASIASSATAQATSDAQLVRLWLHGRNPNTQRAYRREVDAFFLFVGAALRDVTLGDLQDYADTRAHLAPATRARTLNAIKSLFHFAQRVGYLALNVAAAVNVPKVINVLAERILSEPEVDRMLALERDDRNRVLLRLFYAAGIRVSELAGLCWRDCQERTDAGQITVLGKGEKTRAILLTPGTWRDLITLRTAADRDDAVFTSKRTGDHLDVSAIWRIVR